MELRVLFYLGMAAACGIVLKFNLALLSEFGGPVRLNKSWAQSVLRHISFVQQKTTTAKKQAQ